MNPLNLKHLAELLLQRMNENSDDGMEVNLCEDARDDISLNAGDILIENVSAFADVTEEDAGFSEAIAELSGRIRYIPGHFELVEEPKQ